MVVRREKALAVLSAFATLASGAPDAPLSGRIFQVIGLPIETARKVILYGTARGVLSAAVRLGIVGSYQAQQMQHDSPCTETVRGQIRH